MPRTAMRFVPARSSVIASLSSMTLGCATRDRLARHLGEHSGRRAAEAVLVEMTDRRVLEVDLDGRRAGSHRDARKIGRRVDDAGRADADQQIALLERVAGAADD